MKKITLALLIAASTSTLAFAQPGQGRGPGANPEFVSDLLAELQIDDGRAQEIQAIMQATHEKKVAVMGTARDEAKALRKASHEQIAAILSEEEMTKFKQGMRDHKKSFKRGKKNCGGGNGPGNGQGNGPGANNDF